MTYIIPVGTSVFYLTSDPSPASNGTWMHSITTKQVTYTDEDILPKKNLYPATDYVFALPANDKDYQAVRVNKAWVICL